MGWAVCGWGARRTMPAGVRRPAFKTLKNLNCKRRNLEIFVDKIKTHNYYCQIFTGRI